MKGEILRIARIYRLRISSLGDVSSSEKILLQTRGTRNNWIRYRCSKFRSISIFFPRFSFVSYRRKCNLISSERRIRKNYEIHHRSIKNFLSRIIQNWWRIFITKLRSIRR